MNYRKADYDVFTTNDYSIFKHLKENRDVKKKRVDEIRKSIDEVGYVRNPLIVNEKMEIIDGQGRFEVLKEKGYPVEFVIDEGIGVDECRAMNSQQSNWTLLDHVDSRCASGDEEYLNLRRLLDKYPMFNLSTIYAVSKGHMVCGGGGNMLSGYIKEGRINFTKEVYLHGIEALDYIKQYVDVSNTIGGSKSLFYTIIGFIYTSQLCDTKRLYEQIVKYYYKITPVATTKQTLRDITEVYNYHLKSDKIYFEIEWERIGKERKSENARQQLTRINGEKRSE